MFKSYTTSDNLLLPLSLGEMIPQNDPVRVVHRIIEQIDLKSLYRKYSHLGSHAYHPRLMLKLIIYAYLRNVYSSRPIEELSRNDIRFLWLSGMIIPDHNTSNRFRSGRLKGVLKEVFGTIVKFLEAEGFVSLERAYTDGTKIESAANRYAFVWGKSIQTRTGKIAEEMNEQFITNYTLHQTTSDTTTYIDHLEQYKSLYGLYPKESIADAGYGCE
ncbi:MAG: transposase [Synergistaceae bacterium]|nr:transposase [Synergistaceae bacterium]